METNNTNEETQYECSDCGSPVNEEDEICPNCGSDLNETAIEEEIIINENPVLYYVSKATNILSWIFLIIFVIMGIFIEKPILIENIAFIRMFFILTGIILFINFQFIYGVLITLLKIEVNTRK